MKLNWQLYKMYVVLSVFVLVCTAGVALSSTLNPEAYVRGLHHFLDAGDPQPLAYTDEVAVILLSTPLLLVLLPLLSLPLGAAQPAQWLRTKEDYEAIIQYWVAHLWLPLGVALVARISNDDDWPIFLMMLILYPLYMEAAFDIVALTPRKGMVLRTLARLPIHALRCILYVMLAMSGVIGCCLVLCAVAASYLFFEAEPSASVT